VKRAGVVVAVAGRAYHGEEGRRPLEERRRNDDGESLYRKQAGPGAWWLQARISIRLHLLES